MSDFARAGALPVPEPEAAPPPPFCGCFLLDGDATAKRMFGLLHLVSVGIFLLQLAGSLAVIGIYSLGSAV